MSHSSSSKISFEEYAQSTLLLDVLFLKLSEDSLTVTEDLSLSCAHILLTIITTHFNDLIIDIDTQLPQNSHTH